MIYQGLRLLLGVSSSIAAHRALDIASSVVKGGGQVRVVMTPHATRLVGPTAFEAITSQRVVVDLWEAHHAGEMDHLAATKWANVFCVAPASAATLARLALGIADDALSTLAVSWPKPMVIAPAMNPTMYAHQTVQDHVATLRNRGNVLVGPQVGPTACGDVGLGRMADVDDILIDIVEALRTEAARPDLKGEHLLITSGPTREFADPVRCITNPSTGRMGVALARQAVHCGARVTLVTGPTEMAPPPGLAGLERITTAEQMKDAVLRHLPAATTAIFAAAVSDWRPAAPEPHKMKKEGAAEEMMLRLVRTPDVAATAREHAQPGQLFIGFAAESRDIEENARTKMHRKAFDLIVANPINEAGAGFASDTNRATILRPDAPPRVVPSMSKERLALEILREVAALRKQRGAAPPPSAATPDYPLGLGDA